MSDIGVELESILNQYDYLYYRATDKGLQLVETFLNNESIFVDYYLIPNEKKSLIEKFVV